MYKHTHTESCVARNTGAGKKERGIEREREGERERARERERDAYSSYICTNTHTLKAAWRETPALERRRK